MNQRASYTELSAAIVQHIPRTTGSGGKVRDLGWELFDRSVDTGPLEVDSCLLAIAILSGTKTGYRDRTEYSLFGSKVHRLLAIYGTKEQREFAHWLYDMLDDAIEAEAERFRLSNVKNRNPATLTAFKLSLAERFNDMLLEMK